MRVVLGALLGAVLVFPGTVIVKVIVEELKIQPDVTFAEACMVIAVILLSILLLRRNRVSAQQAEEVNHFERW